MIKSMTGYGRAESDAEGRGILVEIKSVNHRYFEFSSRKTRGYNFLDEKLKSYVQSLSLIHISSLVWRASACYH